ncbi:hypothetical protein Poly41_06610 [Novipirellula artificiosorum]|uniref:Uncharacterized protein n=1 Tax=Novipirellula artificiosorum TaxID=2528016 RepID=A0A5C6E1K7_9BACT|nr:hypothetical protein Poly41_06610 [Novipirellula artificiosorum]
MTFAGVACVARWQCQMASPTLAAQSEIDSANYSKCPQSGAVQLARIIHPSKPIPRNPLYAISLHRLSKEQTAHVGVVGFSRFSKVQPQSAKAYHSNESSGLGMRTS